MKIEEKNEKKNDRDGEDQEQDLGRRIFLEMRRVVAGPQKQLQKLFIKYLIGKYILFFLSVVSISITRWRCYTLKCFKKHKSYSHSLKFIINRNN